MTGLSAGSNVGHNYHVNISCGSLTSIINNLLSELTLHDPGFIDVVNIKIKLFVLYTV